ncbi:hypothetical protein [Streptomyces sp. NPDC057617]|uniref:hypothetical protein n=1 Tax=Streptomyces sp. NPDC057617 TaxID=3346184 RepID=UPI0036772394
MIQPPLLIQQFSAQLGELVQAISAQIACVSRTPDSLFAGDRTSAPFPEQPSDGDAPSLNLAVHLVGCNRRFLWPLQHYEGEGFLDF